MKYRSLVASLSLCLFGQSLPLQAADHPLISPYPGASVRKSLQVDYESFRVPVGLNSEGSEPFVFEELVGDLNQQTFEINQVSTLKLFENYQAAVKKLGFKVRFQCELDQCGDERRASQLGALVSPQQSVYNFYRKPYYLVAQGQGQKGTVTLALFIGGWEGNAYVQQLVIEEEPLDANLIGVTPAYLQQQPPATVATQETVPPGEDHPLLARYPGAKLNKKLHADYERFELPLKGGQTLALAGDLTRHTYTIPNASSLKVAENYQAAMQKLGFETLYRCDLSDCGDDRQAQKLGAAISVNNSVYNFYRNPYYLVAKGTSGKGDLYAAIFIGAYEDQVGVQQLLLETEALETDLVSVDPDGLKRELDQTGKALIYGIYFDTDKAVVKPESKPALDAIAGLLRQHPTLNLYVVGHTDDSGSLQHNQELSTARAKAVVAALVGDYQIQASRLLGQGVGPFAPAATNRSDAGKQSNRRVELVQRLQ